MFTFSLELLDLEFNNSTRLQAYQKLLKTFELLHHKLTLYFIPNKDLAEDIDFENPSIFCYQVKRKAIEVVFGANMIEVALQWGVGGIEGSLYLLLTEHVEDCFFVYMGKKELIIARMFVEGLIILIDNFTKIPKKQLKRKNLFWRKLLPVIRAVNPSYSRREYRKNI
ncbi:MAG: hypothetical protein F6K55_43415 [Moorea sp. SIO4A3]|nr:hypothetical protein [Moorena sp. SIO4A3]